MRATISAKAQRLLKQYEEDLHVRLAESSIGPYLRGARDLLAWMAARTLELAELRGEDLLAYQSELLARQDKQGRPFPPSYAHNAVTRIKSFFRFLCRRGVLLHDPSSRLVRPRQEFRLPRVILTPAEARRILEAVRGRSPRDVRDRAILELFYATGLRVGELTALSPSDIDTEARVVRVRLGKGGKDRNVPLTPAAARAIERYQLVRPRLAAKKRRPPLLLFLSDLGGKLHRAIVSKMVRRHTRRAGVKKKVTPHTFRHSMATHLLKGRADIRHIQVLLGHARLSSTERYTRVEIGDLRKVVDRAHPRGR